MIAHEWLALESVTARMAWLSAAMCVGIVLLTPCSLNAESLSIGQTFEPQGATVAYDRPRVDLISSLFAKKQTVKIGETYVVIEQHFKDSPFGPQLWLKIAPIENATVSKDAAAWVKLPKEQTKDAAKEIDALIKAK